MIIITDAEIKFKAVNDFTFESSLQDSTACSV